METTFYNLSRSKSRLSADERTAVFQLADSLDGIAAPFASWLIDPASDGLPEFTAAEIIDGIGAIAAMRRHADTDGLEMFFDELLGVLLREALTRMER